MHEVAFATHGAGQFLAGGNGNPHNLDSFQRPGHYTWHGQALAILRPARPGVLRFTATANGLRPATVELTVR